jgi:hypothetical protein
MALASRELWSSTTRAGHPRIEPEDVSRVQFATEAGAGILAVGTPMVWTAGVWHSYVDADGFIDGFVYPVAVQLSASTETLGVVMTSGQIHYDDIPKEAALVGTVTQAAVDAELKNMSSANRKLRIDGLAGVR